MTKIFEIMAESLEIDVGDIGTDLIFREHGSWNSLAALSLITALEDEFGVVLGDTDLQEVITVQDLMDFVAKWSTKRNKDV